MLNGIVTLVQERRFQLVDNDGVAHLFVLAAEAPVDPDALSRIEQSGARIGVAYHDSPHLTAHVAIDIAWIENNAEARI